MIIVSYILSPTQSRQTSSALCTRCNNPPAEWYTEVHNPPADCSTECNNAPKSRRIGTLGATMRRRIVAHRCTIPPADCYTECTIRRMFVETELYFPIWIVFQLCLTFALIFTNFSEYGEFRKLYQFKRQDCNGSCFSCRFQETQWICWSYNDTKKSVKSRPNTWNEEEKITRT